MGRSASGLAVSVAGCGSADLSAMGTVSIYRDGFLLVPPRQKPSGPTAKGQVDVSSSTVAVAMQTHKLTGPDFL